MVGHVDDARLPRVIVAAEEILLRAHAHVGSGHGNVGVPGEIVGCVIDRAVAAAMRRDEIRRPLALRHALALPLGRSRRRSTGPRRADTRSSPAWRDRPRNRRRAERTIGTPRERASPRSPTRGTSARAACGCTPALSVRSSALPGCRQTPCMPFIRAIGSWSLSQTVFEPSACSST